MAKRRGRPQAGRQGLTSEKNVTKLVTPSQAQGTGRLMRVIAWKRLREFADKHPHALAPLKVWIRLMETHAFQGPPDVRQLFGANVDFLPDDLVVFDVGGNKYRISVNIRYSKQLVFIREVMTHQEYDRRTKKGTL